MLKALISTSSNIKRAALATREDPILWTLGTKEDQSTHIGICKGRVFPKGCKRSKNCFKTLCCITVTCFARPLQISMFLVGLLRKLEVIKVNITKHLYLQYILSPSSTQDHKKKMCSTDLLKKHVNSISLWTIFVLHPAKTSYIDSVVSSKVQKSPKYIVFDPEKNKVWQIFDPGAAPAAERREYHWHCEISFIMPQKLLKIKYGLKSDRLSICHSVNGSLAIFQPSPVVSTNVVPLASPAISNTGMSQSELRCIRLFYYAAGTYAIYFRNPGTLETIDVSWHMLRPMWLVTNSPK